MANEFLLVKIVHFSCYWLAVHYFNLGPNLVRKHRICALSEPVRLRLPRSLLSSLQLVLAVLLSAETLVRILVFLLIAVSTRSIVVLLDSGVLLPKQRGTRKFVRKRIIGIVCVSGGILHHFVQLLSAA